jgi:hypothetical protein
MSSTEDLCRCVYHDGDGNHGHQSIATTIVDFTKVAGPGSPDVQMCRPCASWWADRHNVEVLEVS